MSVEIKYVPDGLGNRFNDHIELNENLLKPEYKQIHDIILAHELAHTNEVFTFKDLALDLGESNINRLDLLKFMIKHPRSFSQLLPITWSRKHGFIYDLNLCLIYLFFIFIITGTAYLAI